MKPVIAPLPQPRRRRPRAAVPPTPGSAADARRADRSIIIVGVVVLVGGLGLLVWAISDVVLLVFGGTLVALFLRGLAKSVQRVTHLSYLPALALVLVVLAVLIVAGGYFLGAETANQLDQLGPQLREAQDQILGSLRRFQWGRTLLAESEKNLTALVPNKGDWLVRLGGIFSTTVGAVAGFIIVIFIGLYGAADPHTYEGGLLYLIPKDNRERAKEVIDEVVDTLRGWMVGTVLKMTVVGVAVAVGLTLLGMPVALALGLIAFALEFAPYIGPTLAACPALLVALAVGPDQALYVLMLYLGVQAMESYVVSPLIDQRSVNLPPAFTIGAQVLLGALLGALGVLFATPLAATAVVLIRALYVDEEEPPLASPAEISPPDATAPDTGPPAA